MRCVQSYSLYRPLISLDLLDSLWVYLVCLLYCNVCWCFTIYMDWKKSIFALFWTYAIFLTKNRQQAVVNKRLVACMVMVSYSAFIPRQLPAPLLRVLLERGMGYMIHSSCRDGHRT